MDENNEKTRKQVEEILQLLKTQSELIKDYQREYWLQQEREDKARQAEYEAKQTERKNIEKIFLETGDPAIITSGQRVSAKEICREIFENHLDKLSREETLAVLKHIDNKGEIEEKQLDWPKASWAYRSCAEIYLKWIQSIQPINTSNAMKIGGTIQAFSLKSQMAYLSLLIEWFGYASPEHSKTALHILRRIITRNEKIAILPLTLQRIHEQVPKIKDPSVQMQMLHILSAYPDHRNIMFFFNALHNDDHDDAQPENQRLQAQVALFLRTYTLPQHFSDYIEEWEKIARHSTHRALAAKAGAILLNQGRITAEFFYQNLIAPYTFKRKDLKRIFETLEGDSPLSILNPLKDIHFLDMLYQMLKHQDLNIQNRAVFQLCKLPLTEATIQKLHHTLNNTSGHQRDFVVKHFGHVLSNGDLAPEIRQLQAFGDAVQDILAVKLETSLPQTLLYLAKLERLSHA
jgi:hypothetical protein